MSANKPLFNFNALCGSKAASHGQVQHGQVQLAKAGKDQKDELEIASIHRVAAEVLLEPDDERSPDGYRSLTAHEHRLHDFHNEWMSYRQRSRGQTRREAAHRCKLVEDHSGQTRSQNPRGTGTRILHRERATQRERFLLNRQNNHLPQSIFHTCEKSSVSAQ